MANLSCAKFRPLNLRINKYEMTLKLWSDSNEKNTKMHSTQHPDNLNSPFFANDTVDGFSVLFTHMINKVGQG